MNNKMMRAGLPLLFLLPLALAGCIDESNRDEEVLEWQLKWAEIQGQRSYTQHGGTTGVRACPSEWHGLSEYDETDHLDWNQYVDGPQILVDAFNAGIESPGNGCAIMHTNYEYATDVIENLYDEWHRQFPNSEDPLEEGSLIPVLYNETHRLVDLIIYISHPPGADYPVEMRASTGIADFEIQGVGPLFGEARFHTDDAPPDGAESFHWGRGTNITWVLLEAEWTCSEDTCPLDWSVTNKDGESIDEITVADTYRLEFFIDEHDVDYDMAWSARASSEFTMELNGTIAVTVFQSGEIPEDYSALS